MQMNGKRMTTTMSSRYHIIISKPPPSSKFRKNCPECDELREGAETKVSSPALSSVVSLTTVMAVDLPADAGL